MRYYLRVWSILFGMIFVLAWMIAPETVGSDKGIVREEAPRASGRDRSRTLRILHGGAVEQMDMADYLAGVLRAEMPASFETEALKAQAIAARTYTLYRMENGSAAAAHPDADACDDITCCKAYMSAETAAEEWGTMAVYYEQKIESAVEETDGKVVLYDGAPVLAVFFSSAAGCTQNAGAVWQSDLPYLQSVSSPETQELVPNYYSTVSFSVEQFRSLITAAYPDAKFNAGAAIENLRRSDSGYVISAQVGGLTLRGNDIRTALSLRSPCFTVEEDGSTITFHVTGYGHGVGMSQYGANILAGEGKSCEEILEHYYSGAKVAVWGE